MVHLMLVFLGFCVSLQLVWCDRHADRLFKDLLTHYNTYERPLLNASEKVAVDFGVALHQLVALDERSQTIETILFFKFMWVDVNLDWEPSEYGGIGEIHMPINLIWKPDILLYNSADTPWDRTYPVPAIVYHNGTVRWRPPGYVKSSCKVDVTYFPFDDQECKFKYSSWTYDFYKLDLRNESGVVDTSFYMPSSDWSLISTKVVRTVSKYECCPIPYVDVTFYIHLRRRTLSYGANLIMPTLVTSLMAFLAFALPSESGEKIALEISVLLSLLFCLQMLADRSPPTSESIPLLGLFFLCCTVLVALSTVMSVIVLNRHHTDPDTADMTDLEKLILLYLLPKLVGIQRPPIDQQRFPFTDENPPIKKPKLRKWKSQKFNTVRIQKCEECQEDLSVPCTCQGLIEFQYPSGSGRTVRIEQKEKEERQEDIPPPPPYPTNTIRQRNTSKSNAELSDEPDQTVSVNLKTQLKAKMIRRIDRPLHEITECIKKGAKEDMIRNEWQYAARAIDRLCLYLFFGLVFLISCAFYYSSPHIVA